nr:MFS transporter [Erwinia persicina]
MAVGPVAGGWLVSMFGWQSVFLLNVPLILLSFMLCLEQIPSAPPSPRPRVDYRGWILMVAGLVPLLVWSGYVKHWGWSAFVSLATLGTAILFLLVFVRVERQTVQPLIDFSVLGCGAFCRACVLSVLLAIFYCVAFMLMPFRLVERFGLSDAQLGLMLLPVTLVMALISPVAGRLGDRYGPWRVMTAGFFLLTCSALLQSASASTLSLSRIALAGVMMGAILGLSVTAALNALPPPQHGQGIGIAWTLHNLGGALGLVVATRMYQSGGAVYGYQWVMWLLVLLSCMGGGVALYSVHSASRTAAGAEG